MAIKSGMYTIKGLADWQAKKLGKALVEEGFEKSVEGVYRQTPKTFFFWPYLDKSTGEKRSSFITRDQEAIERAKQLV